MEKFFRKALALTLVLCSLLGLLLPAATKVSAVEYPFADIGEEVDLGVVLKGNLNISGLVETFDYNGRQYLAVPIKGSKLCVFGVTDCIEGKTNADGNYIHAMVDSGIGIPRGVAVDSKGAIYATGDSKSVFWYSMSSGKTGSISVSGSGGLTTVCVDANDNIYTVGSEGGGSVYRIDGKTKTSKRIYTSSDFTAISGVVCGGGKVFVQCTVKSSAGGGARILMLSDSGSLLSSYDLPNSAGSYYLSYIDGVVFMGIHSGTSSEGFVALDTAGNKLTRLDMGKNSTILGMVTNPTGGKAYMCIAEDGTYEYDVATRKLTRKVSGTCNRPLRCKNYVRSGSELLLLSTGPSSVTTIKGPSGNTISLSGLLKDAYSTYSPRSMTAGVPGTGVAVYVGAYLSGSVGSYSPGAENPIDSSVFSNGHAQSDSMITYNGKIYVGAYSGAFLVEYDPATDTTRELIHGLKDEYSQLRIHGLVAGDNKIFFSTIPQDQALGGAIGWYDLSKDTWYCQRNVVFDQSTIALAYDEEANILFGGTTIRGGTNSTPTASQAVLYAYDVKEKRVLDQVTVGNLTGDRPKMISSLAKDPDTGKLWGCVSQTVFSFTCENGKLSVTKEWQAATTPSEPYPDGGSISWFPKPIQFDGNGNMYSAFVEDKYGIMKFTIGENGKIKKAESIANVNTRIYSLGADGNMYYYDNQLHMISLNDRVSTVELLIDNAAGKDAIAEARWAYDSLTQKEKERLGEVYYQKLLNMESGNNKGVLDAINAINAIGLVTAESGPAIENARRFYDSLTVAQKKQVTNVQTLLDAEKAYLRLTTPDEDAPANPVDTVTALIDAIGEVTADSGAAIQTARVAYDDLTDKQKREVTNAQVLLDAEKAYLAILTQSGDADKENPDTQEEIDLAAASLVKAQIDSIGEVTAASGPIIRLARQAYDALTPEQQAKVSNAQILFDAEEALKAFDSDASEEKGSVVVIVVVVVAVLAAGGAAAFFFLKKKKSDMPCHSEEAAATEESAPAEETPAE